MNSPFQTHNVLRQLPPPMTFVSKTVQEIAKLILFIPEKVFVERQMALFGQSNLVF